MIKVTDMLAYPVPDLFRVAINGVAYERDMTSSQMRILAIRLLQSAEEMDTGVAFTKDRLP